MIGRVLAKYKILEEVGQGGMSVVYRGLDTALQREVAIKVLHPHLAASDEARDRFEREAHAVAKLRHENILEIFDYSGRESPESYIVTEFIHGGTLRGFCTEHTLELPEAGAMIVLEVCRALVHAHRQGILHRDVKPENIMIRDDGVVKLTDFGIAQIVDAQRMTMTGQLLGSPAYMAPEHVDGKPLDFRTDVFSVGILLYQLTTGELPFKGRNPHEILKRIAECKYLDPRVVNPGVSDELGKIIGRSLRREPGERYQDVAAFEADLTACLAEVGLTDARVELRALFADPAAYQVELRRRLITALTDLGKRALAGRRAAAALAAWNRVLVLDPAHGEVLGLIDSLSRRRRALRLGAAGGLLALAAAGIAAALAFRPVEPLPMPVAHAVVKPPEPRPTPKTPDLPQAPPAAEESSTQASVSGSHALPRPPRPEAKPVAVADEPPVAARREFRLVPSPRNAAYSVDGGEFTQITSGAGTIQVGPGRHLVTFRHPRCDDTVHEITPDADSGDIAIRLKWKPARLVARCAAATAIAVNGRPLDNNTPIDVFEFPRSGRAPHTVEFQVGGETVTKEVMVTAGDTLLEVTCD